MNDYYLRSLNKYLNFKDLERNIAEIDSTTIRELESRFEIDYSIDDIIKKLNSLQKFDIINEKTIVEYHQDNQRIVVDEEIWENTINKNTFTTGEYKNQLSSKKINVQGYTINFAFSHEKQIEIERIHNPKIRRRNRYIIKNFLNDKYDLHLTSSFDPFIKRDKNLIEIEYNIEKIKTLGELIYPIKYIFDLMYVRSFLLLHPDEMQTVIDHFNDYLRKLKRTLTKIDIDNISNKRLIRYQDNPVPIKSNNIKFVKTDKYYVTNKLNGTRYFLFIDNGSLYLLGKTGSKISTIPTNVWKIDTIQINIHSDYNYTQTYILDGEYFDKEYIDFLKTEKYRPKITTYFAFDIIWFNNIPLSDTPYDMRLNYLNNVVNMKSFINMPLTMKYIVLGNNTIDVLRFMKKTFGEDWDEDNDGLIYTDVKNIYGNKNFKTLKWKFLHHQSVDVSVKKEDINDNNFISKDLYSCYVMNKDDNLERFTNFFLYSPRKFLNGSIVEVSFDKKEKLFYPLRLRTDKEIPNFISVANDFWNDINDDIKLSKLISKPLYLKNSLDDWKNYRKNCANKEKSKLIKTIDPNNIVVDIGFGKGGDLFKYKDQGIKRIVGVEPDFNNILEFFDRFKISDYDIDDIQNTKIFDRLVRVQDTDIHITIINRSASDSDIPDIILELLKDNKQNIIVTMFFSLTYFFNPYDDFVKLIYNICKINPLQIIGTVMDGKKTKQFLNKFYWNTEKCGLELKLISQNKLFISIAESATVSGHNEYLTDLDRFENNLFWYYFKLIDKTYFNFDLGANNLLTHFASLNCSFKFYNQSPKYSIRTKEGITIQKPMNHLYQINKLIISFNYKLGLNLDSNYFYTCFRNLQLKERYDISETIKQIENFQNSRNISKYYIKKVVDESDNSIDKELYYFVYNDQEFELNLENLNKARSLLLKNKIDDTFRIIYKIDNNDPYKSNQIAENVLKKIFQTKDADKLILSNQYCDYYSDNENPITNIINIIQKIISPINNYTLIEINPGIGLFTVEFIKNFKNMITITNGSNLNYYFLLNNFINYYNIKYPYENIDKILNKDSLTKSLIVKYKEKDIIFFNNYSDEINIHEINNLIDNSVLFINYLFNDFPNIKDILNINCKYIIIYSKNIINIGKYFKNFYLDIIRNNYLYIISKNDIKNIEEEIILSNISYYFDDKNNTVDLSKLKFTKESVYSVTPWKESKIISDQIEEFFNTNEITVTDATSNVGGNTIGFLEAGFNVNSVEIDKITCDYLKNNISVYNYPISRVYCDNYLEIYKELKQDVIFFDPPWGGTEYAKNKVLDLFLGKVNVIVLIKNIFDDNHAKLVVLKAPNNFNEEKMFDILIDYNIEKIPIYRKGRISYVVYYISNKLNDIIKQSEKFKQEEKEWIQKNINKNIDINTIIDDMLYKYRENKVKELANIKNQKEREFMLKSWYYINWQKGSIIKNK